MVLHGMRFKTQQHHKLKPLHYGPYTVLQQIGPNAYRLDFPQLLLPRGIHDVVNVNSLKHHASKILSSKTMFL